MTDSRDSGGDRALRIGTRGSRLALVQANHVAELLASAHPHLRIEQVIIQTTGDKILDSPLGRIGGKGVFTKEIEDALLGGRIDVAVHSLKDLPVQQPAGLALGAVSARESPRDIVIAAAPIDWRELTGSATLGTSSLRRRAQVARRNPNVRVTELRGNVPTRVRKVVEGHYTAIILAEAGLVRLALEAPFVAPVEFDDMLPAPGQGALGLQIRDHDDDTRALLAPLHDAAAHACCAAERALLQGLGGGCQLPLGALADIDGDMIRLRGRVASLDGAHSCEDQIHGRADDAEALGRALAERLLSLGAREILAALCGRDAEGADGFTTAVKRAAEMDTRPLRGAGVIVTRDEDADGPMSTAIRDLGGQPLILPLVRHLPIEDAEPLRSALSQPHVWIVFTSARAVDAVQAFAPPESMSARIACVGEATARRVRELGGHVEITAPAGTAQSLAEAMAPRVNGARVLYPRADRARPALADALRHAGAIVDDVIAYRTVFTGSRAAALAVLDQPQARAILFASASAVEALADLIGDAARLVLPAHLVVASMGPTTTDALARVGVAAHTEPDTRTFEGLAAAVVERLRESD